MEFLELHTGKAKRRLQENSVVEVVERSALLCSLFKNHRSVKINPREMNFRGGRLFMPLYLYSPQCIVKVQFHKDTLPFCICRQKCMGKERSCAEHRQCVTLALKCGDISALPLGSPQCLDFPFIYNAQETVENRNLRLYSELRSVSRIVFFLHFYRSYFFRFLNSLLYLQCKSFKDAFQTIKTNIS
jgi:hypothetical protein